MADLLVVGLDLDTGQEVHAGEREIWEWYRKGHNGDRTLVCVQCYNGSDVADGPLVVALVPKGRRGGARRPHFAHPPGMAPPGGRHSRESRWHAEAKQRMRRWAADQGASARVEAWTDDRHRRSDVAVTLAGGRQVAIEVQLGPVSDAEWLARHHDYARANIADVWLWHAATWVPRVMFDAGQPGWILDLDHDELGLIYSKPDPVTGPGQPTCPPGCRTVHWPPCTGDQLDTLWLSLDSAQLSPEGIRPSAAAIAQIAKQAAAAAKRATSSARASAKPGQNSARPTTTPAMAATGRQPVTHQAFRYDAQPPSSDPNAWWYLCDTCGRSRMTGAELKGSPIIHIVPTLKRLTSTGKPLVSYVQHGGTAAAPSRKSPQARPGGHDRDTPGDESARICSPETAV